MKIKNKLRNALIRALGGYTENGISAADIHTPRILSGIIKYELTKVKSGIRVEDMDISDLRMKTLLTQHLAKELDRRGFISYEKKGDGFNVEFIGSIIIANMIEEE